MKIEFYWNGSFLGDTYDMIVNGKLFSLGGAVSNPDEASKDAIKILKEQYNIDYDINEIDFKWGGRL